MNRTFRRRLALAAAAMATLGAAGGLLGSSSLALFSGTEAGSGNTFTAGTVTVGLGTGTSVTCTVSNMNPGDSSAGAPIGSKADSSCVWYVKYTGNVSAWLGVDVNITNGSTALYDGTANGLQLYLKDANSTTYLTSTAPTAGTTYKNSGGTATSLPTGTTADLLVSTTAATSGTAATFTLDYALPIASGNTYQGGSATVTLTFHAVQSTDQTLPSACTYAGYQCPAATGFAWS
jgi:hypothetical protein